MKHPKQHSTFDKYVFQKPTFSQPQQLRPELQQEDSLSSYYPVQPPTWFEDYEKQRRFLWKQSSL